jgi:hypothetical protein
MINEVVVSDDGIRTVVPFEPMNYDEMVLVALGERAADRRRAAGARRAGLLSRGARS